MKDNRLRAVVAVLILLWVLALVVGCHPAPVIKTVEVPASVHCEGPDCIMVTRTFVDEHGSLFAENIKLKAALKACREQGGQ